MKRVSKLSVALLFLTFICARAEAKVWRVNNVPNVVADFKDLGVALASPLVLPYDTIYLEGSTTSYPSTTLRKRLVIIGAGYNLSGASGNSGLQFNNSPSRVASLQVDSSASGSTFMGIYSLFYVNSNVDSLTFSRCEINIQQNSFSPNSKMAGIVINKCYGGISLSSYTLENPVITNCIFTTPVSLTSVINGLFRNNVCGASISLSNSYVANNYFQNSTTFSNCTVKYNVAALVSALPTGNNNIAPVNVSTMFVAAGSNDAQYQLRPGSPGIGAGEPIGGVTPDVGAFGTADPYRLSGIPPIPTIYSLTVPTSVPASATNITVTFSTRSNN